MEELYNKLEATLKISEKEIIDFAMNSNGYETVNAEHLRDNFPDIFKCMKEAEQFINRFSSFSRYDLETNPTGIGIYYSPRTSRYFIVFGHSDYYNITLNVKAMGKVAFEGWLEYVG